MTAYDGALAYLDSEIGRLLDALERRGALDRTLVIVTSDHGEEFGEHRLYDHGHSLYLASLHVPLVVIAPGWTPPRTVVDEPVSLRDVPATILDFVNASAATRLPGRSLARFWTAAESSSTGELVVSGVRHVRGQPAWYPVSRGDLVSLVDGPLRYIRNLGDGTEELFNYRLDPDERVDLSHRSEHLATLQRFRGRIEASRRVAAASR
jgi:arylsulfatase A-like enzyme